MVNVIKKIKIKIYNIMKTILFCIILCLCSSCCIINKWKFWSINTIPSIEPSIANVVLPQYYYVSCCLCITILLLIGLSYIL